jgi:HSP20 family protein
MANGNIERQPKDSPENVKERPALTPRVDVYENDREYLLVADLPGVAKDQLSINLDNDELVLDARREDEDVGALVAGEFRALDYRRKFSLPQGVDRGKIDAELSGGVLRLHLPKAEALRPRRIEVRVG